MFSIIYTTQNLEFVCFGPMSLVDLGLCLYVNVAQVGTGSCGSRSYSVL